MIDNDDPLSGPRGVLHGVLMVIPMWVLVALTIWIVTAGSRRVHDAQIAAANAPKPLSIEARR